LNEVFDDTDHPRGQHIGPLAENVWQGVAQPVQPLPDGDAMLEKETANLIDDCSAFPYEPGADPMQRLQIELLICLYRNTARCGALNGFGDGKSVTEIVLVRWPERLCIERWHLPHVVTEAAEIACQVMGAHSRLDADQAGSNVRKPGNSVTAGGFLPQHNGPLSIEAYQMKGVLTRVDTDGGQA
jgi:hypothetical protein